MSLHESNQEFLSKHKGEQITRRFLHTLWVLRLNPNPVPVDMHSMLNQLLRELSSSFFGDGS